MKLQTHECSRYDLAIDGITDETVWKLQEMGIKFTDQDTPILPSGSMTLLELRSGNTTEQSPVIRNLSEHT